MLTEKKKEKISRKIEECGSDGKNLFQLVNHLTGHNQTSTTNQEVR